MGMIFTAIFKKIKDKDLEKVQLVLNSGINLLWYVQKSAAAVY